MSLNSINFMALSFGLLSVLFASPVIANEKEKTLSVHFNPGAVMQLIAPVTEAEKRPLRDKYFELGASTAREYGYTQHGVLVVEKTLIGTFSPNVFVVSQWPSLNAQKSFQSLPLFSEIKALRREAWEALKLYDYEVTKPTTLTFSTDKIYSVSLAWVNPKAPNNYYDFIDSFAKKAQALGGKVISITQDISLSDHNPYAVAPQQIVILEWNSANDIEAVLASSEYAAQLEKLKNGTVDFELHAVRPRV
ncbi:hypothetical protein E5672_08565 [Alteromonas portus]|uniref:DUF1330 domain-containing protein n=1 Tax=Alteromonas portus TaxID=2565549 RepID=A0A4U0ZEP9_9ALTE|nr:hypothetical protein [Alteromonas portus]TKB03097.1 hypothetical protein E5672_08565 [Alteromonas portus]